MRNDRPYAIPLYITEIPVLSKTYDKAKLDEDLGVGIHGIYQDHGYFKVNGQRSGGRTSWMMFTAAFRPAAADRLEKWQAR